MKKMLDDLLAKHDSPAKLPITRKTLAELNSIALNHPFDLSSLTYTETQQVLTLWSLTQYFEDMGIDSPFVLTVPGTEAGSRG